MKPPSRIQRRHVRSDRPEEGPEPPRLGKPSLNPDRPDVKGVGVTTLQSNPHLIRRQKTKADGVLVQKLFKWRHSPFDTASFRLLSNNAVSGW